MSVFYRLKAAWLALMGKPICTSLPPVFWLEIAPDDQIFLETEKHLTPEQRETLKTQMNGWLSGKPKIIILDGGIKLVAVRRNPQGKQ